jgi:hypothetical protein
LNPDTHFLQMTQTIVSGQDSANSALRLAFNLPNVPASAVTVVTSTSICNRAAAAFGLALTPPDTSAGQRPISVLLVGTNRYIVTEPDVLVGEFTVHTVFDTTFSAPLASYLN